MKPCEYYENCNHHNKDDLCLEISEHCKIRQNYLKYIFKPKEVDEDIIEQINLEGMVR